MKSIKNIICLAGIIGIVILIRKKTKKKLDALQQLSNKHLDLYLMMNQWVRVKQEGKNISNYLIENRYKKIAIYGMSYAGKTLIRELEKTEVEVAYVIDKHADDIYTDIKMISDANPSIKIDAVIVTAITSYNEIKEELQKKLLLPILSLEDILYEI